MLPSFRVECSYGKYLTTLWLEFEPARDKVELGWVLISYFLARYPRTSLGFIIACLLFQTSERLVDYDGNLLGQVAIASVSAKLVVRTAVIWSYQWYIPLLLGELVIGQIVLIGVGA